jgi:uncharacterized protein YjcR
LANKPIIDKEEILKQYDKGETPVNLATKWGVHPTTIRRWIRSSGRSKAKFSHTTNLDKESKVQLRNILLKYNVKDLDSVISELDTHFIIETRKTEEDKDFPIIILK